MILWVVQNTRMKRKTEKRDEWFLAKLSQEVNINSIQQNKLHLWTKVW
jgi:hypothetical protein